MQIYDMELGSLGRKDQRISRRLLGIQTHGSIVGCVVRILNTNHSNMMFEYRYVELSFRICYAERATSETIFIIHEHEDDTFTNVYKKEIGQC